MVSTSVLIYFGTPQLGHTIKTNCKKCDNAYKKYTQFWLFIKGLGLVFPPHFLQFFQENYLSLYFASYF